MPLTRGAPAREEALVQVEELRGQEAARRCRLLLLRLRRVQQLLRRRRRRRRRLRRQELAELVLGGRPLFVQCGECISKHFT